jgi:4-amino-4-deoxy-L-arabinose transferase-like glycosyltransferase
LSESESRERVARYVPGVLYPLLILGVLLGWHFYHGIQGDHWTQPPRPHGDGPDYESIAYSLNQGEGFQFSWQSPEWQQPYRDAPDAADYTQLVRIDWPGPTASRPPLYPVIISAIYIVFPRGSAGFVAVRGFSIVCTALAGTLAVCGAYAIARKIFPSIGLAVLSAGAAMGLAMLDRTVRTYSVDFLTEPLAMLLCTAIGVCGIRWQQQNGVRAWLILLAALVAAAVLTRSMMIFWLPGLAVLVVGSCERHRFRGMLLFVALVLALLSPWWLRNCLVMQRFMPLGGQGAASLSGGYCDEAFADWGNWHGAVEEQLQRELDSVPGSKAWTQVQREVALAELATRRTATWVDTNAIRIPWLMAMRIVSHWGPFTGTSLVWRLAILTGWIGLIALRRRETVWILGLPVISTATVAILYETGGRFLVPLYAMLYLTAGLGSAFFVQLLHHFWSNLRGLYRS